MKKIVLTLAGAAAVATTAFAPVANAGYYGHKVHSHRHHYYKPYYTYRYVPVCGEFAWVWVHGHKKWACLWYK